MKTLSFLCGIIMLFSVGESALGHTKKITNSKSKKPQMATITLTAVPIHVPTAGYHAIFTGTGGHRYTAGFPAAGGTNTTSIPPGVYTVAIVPTGGSGSNHTYHATDCSQQLQIKSGTQTSFTNFDVNCGSGSLSIPF